MKKYVNDDGTELWEYPVDYSPRESSTVSYEATEASLNIIFGSTPAKPRHMVHLIIHHHHHHHPRLPNR